jgi:hypothetical protein
MICSWPRMPSSSAPILAHAFSTTTKAIGLGNKLFYCIFGNRSNTSCSCPYFTSHYDNIPRDHVMWGHLVEHSQSLLRATTLGIHVNEATPYKTIWLRTTLNDLLIGKPALFKCQLAHAFNTPTNMTVFGHTPSHVAFVDIDPMPVPMPMFHMSWYDNSPWDHVVWAHLVKHSPSFLHASSMLPHLAYMSTKLFSTKTFDSYHFEWFVHEPTCPPQVLIG